MVWTVSTTGARGGNNYKHREENIQTQTRRNRDAQRRCCGYSAPLTPTKDPATPTLSSLYSLNTSLQPPNAHLLRTQRARVSAEPEVNRTWFSSPKGSQFWRNRSATWFQTGLARWGCHVTCGCDHCSWKTEAGSDSLRR